MLTVGRLTDIWETKKLRIHRSSKFNIIKRWIIKELTKLNAIHEKTNVEFKSRFVNIKRAAC